MSPESQFEMFLVDALTDGRKTPDKLALLDGIENAVKRLRQQVLFEANEFVAVGTNPNGQVLRGE